MSQPLLFQPPAAPAAPFARLTSLTRQAFKTSREVPAAQRRLLTTHFQEAFTWSAIEPLLPLQPVVSPEVPQPPERRYRSCYRWLPPEDVAAATLAGWDDFDLILRLFDFSPWRPLLAQRFQSHRFH